MLYRRMWALSRCQNYTEKGAMLFDNQSSFKPITLKLILFGVKDISYKANSLTFKHVQSYIRDRVIYFDITLSHKRAYSVIDAPSRNFFLSYRTFLYSKTVPLLSLYYVEHTTISRWWMKMFCLCVRYLHYTVTLFCIIETYYIFRFLYWILIPTNILHCCM